jgi:hypothetical protein
MMDKEAHVEPTEQHGVAWKNSSPLEVEHPAHYKFIAESLIRLVFKQS